MRVSLRGAIPAALLAVACLASEAGAAAEVHKLSLALSVIPTGIKAEDFNDNVIGRVNDAVLSPRGMEEVSAIHWGWLFDAQFRYFVRPNVAIEAGAGQLRSSSSREFLPALNASIQYRAEILSVPVHVGGAYYLPGYNQGDFAARGYLGAGLQSITYNYGRFSAVESGTDTSTTLGGTFHASGRADSPGYYLETGVHMFFAARYSVMLGLLYRSSVVREMDITLEQSLPNGSVVSTPAGTIEFDTGGVGGRFALAIGF